MQNLDHARIQLEEDKDWSHRVCITFYNLLSWNASFCTPESRVSGEQAVIDRNHGHLCSSDEI